jgi:hypothetical protein
MFPVFQFTILEEVMQGRTEYIAGADFYCTWGSYNDLILTDLGTVICFDM